MKTRNGARMILGAGVVMTTLLLFQNCSPSLHSLDQASKVSENITLQSVAAAHQGSQYSPFVMKQPGWSHRLMLYCRNSPETQFGSQELWRDRVWRMLEADGVWQSPQIALQSGEQYDEKNPNPTDDLDDLSCSPGAFVEGATMHTYYVTADRDRGMNLYLYYAQSSDNGVTFSQQSVVNLAGVSQPIMDSGGYLETPTPVSVNNKVYLYYIYAAPGSYSQSLYRSEISAMDKTSLTAPVKMKSLSSGAVSHGRVTYVSELGLYVYVYSEGTAADIRPTQIWLETSTDGVDFTQKPRILLLSSGQFFSFSPMAYALGNGDVEVFFAQSPYKEGGHFSSHTTMDSFVVKKESLVGRPQPQETPAPPALRSCVYAGGSMLSTSPGREGVCQYPGTTVAHGQNGVLDAVVGVGQLSGSCNDGAWITINHTCTPPAAAVVPQFKSCHYAGGLGGSTTPGKEGLCEYPAATVTHGQNGEVFATKGTGSIKATCIDGEWNYKYTCNP